MADRLKIDNKHMKDLSGIRGMLSICLSQNLMVNEQTG